MKMSIRYPVARFAAALIGVLSTVSPLSGDEPVETTAKAEVQQLIEAERAEAQHVRTELDLVDTRLSVLQLAATRADGLIGVETAPPDEVLRSHLGLAEGKGLVVTSVVEGGPAAVAGIQVNDVLTAVGGVQIDGVEKLRQLLEASQDKPVSVGFIRAGARQAVEVTTRADELANFVRGGKLYTKFVETEEPKYWLGVGLAGADDVLRSQLGVAAGEGLVVTGVEEDSPAAKAGVMSNDLLLNLDGKPLKTIEELSGQLQEIKDKSVTLELLRRGKPAQLSVTPQLRPEAAMRYVDFDGDGDLDVALVGRSLLIETIKAKQDHPSLATSGISEAAANESLSARVSALLEQTKQFQAELEALQATIKAQTQPPKAAP